MSTPNASLHTHKKAFPLFVELPSQNASQIDDVSRNGHSGQVSQKASSTPVSSTLTTVSNAAQRRPIDTNPPSPPASEEALDEKTPLVNAQAQRHAVESNDKMPKQDDDVIEAHAPPEAEPIPSNEKTGDNTPASSKFNHLITDDQTGKRYLTPEESHHAIKKLNALTKRNEGDTLSGDLKCLYDFHAMLRGFIKEKGEESKNLDKIEAEILKQSKKDNPKTQHIVQSLSNHLQKICQAKEGERKPSDIVIEMTLARLTESDLLKPGEYFLSQERIQYLNTLLDRSKTNILTYYTIMLEDCPELVVNAICVPDENKKEASVSDKPEQTHRAGRKRKWDDMDRPIEAIKKPQIRANRAKKPSSDFKFNFNFSRPGSQTPFSQSAQTSTVSPQATQADRVPGNEEDGEKAQRDQSDLPSNDWQKIGNRYQLVNELKTVQLSELRNTYRQNASAQHQAPAAPNRFNEPDEETLK